MKFPTFFNPFENRRKKKKKKPQPPLGNCKVLQISHGVRRGLIPPPRQLEEPRIWQERLAWGTRWQWQPQLWVSLSPLPHWADPSYFMPPQGQFCHHSSLHDSHHALAVEREGRSSSSHPRGIPRAQAEPGDGMGLDVGWDKMGCAARRLP